MAQARTVVRFRQSTIWLHWIHTAAFLALLVTGAFLFFPGLGGPAAGGITRAIHRIAVIVFVGAPLVYAVFNPRLSWQFVKETFPGAAPITAGSGWHRTTTSAAARPRCRRRGASTPGRRAGS